MAEHGQCVLSLRRSCYSDSTCRLLGSLELSTTGGSVSSRRAGNCRSIVASNGRVDAGQRFHGSLLVGQWLLAALWRNNWALHQKLLLIEWVVAVVVACNRTCTVLMSQHAASRYSGWMQLVYFLACELLWRCRGTPLLTCNLLVLVLVHDAKHISTSFLNDLARLWWMI